MLEPQIGVLAGLRPGATHIDLTTNAPAVIARVAEACRARGVELIDAPVSGRPPAMTVMVGASEAGFATLPAVVRGDRGQCLPCRRQRGRGHRQTGDAIHGLYQFHRLDRGYAGRRQGRARPGDDGAHRAGQRRAEPHVRQYPPRRVLARVCRRGHARHRRQGYGAGLPVGARRRGSGDAGRAGCGSSTSGRRRRAGARMASRSSPGCWRRWPGWNCGQVREARHERRRPSPGCC